MMSGGYHQANQAAQAVQGNTIQYQLGDQVLEIPSNYQFENIIAAGGVSRSRERCLFCIYICTFAYAHTTLSLHVILLFI